MRFWTMIILLSGLAGSGTAAEPAPAGLQPLVGLLGRVDDPAVQADVLRGMRAALNGRRRVGMPDGWRAVYAKLAKSPRADVREQALALSVLFGDREALTALRRVAADPAAPTAARRGAVESLVYARDPELIPVLRALLAERAMRSTALRALAAYADDSTPKLILEHYSSLTAEEKADAVQTLASRPAYALALLDAVESGRVPRRDLSAFTVRQMREFNNKAVTEKVNKVWGVIRPASQERAALMAKYRALLTPEFMKHADASRGRLVFSRTCASCHRLFDSGAAIGPELTGAQRTNLDYVLENVLDPSAVVAREYQVTVIETRDGRVLSGIIKQEADRAVTVQTQNEAVVVPKNEIETRTQSQVSMMPEGLLDKLTREEVRDLVAYLASPRQVPLPKEEARPAGGH